jgi:hypothetical protein
MFTVVMHNVEHNILASLADFRQTFEINNLYIFGILLNFEFCMKISYILT